MIDLGITKNILGWDTETGRIRQELQAPKIVCLSMAEQPAGKGAGFQEKTLLGNDDRQALHDACAVLVRDRSCIKVGHNVGYDLVVICANFPDLIPDVFQALEEEQFACTMIREKLLRLTMTGDLKFETHKDGSKSEIRYGLDAVVKRWRGVDISANKKDSDSYRLYYEDLFDGKPASEYPPEARDYALDDAVWAVDVWQCQETLRQQMIQDRGLDAFTVESFRVFLDFCLKLMSAWGACADPDEVVKIEAMLAGELTYDKLDLLITSGILRPAESPRPHKSAREHVPDCKGKGCNCPPRMTQGKDESVNTNALKDFVTALAAKLNAGRPAHDLAMKLKFTEKSKKFPEGQLSVGKEFLEDYHHTDPVLEQYKHRQDLQKLVTTEIPRMKINGKLVRCIHPQYDCLKETGRDSSFSSKSPDYASFNAQNVDPRIRKAYTARPGYLLFSIDYQTMELGTLAQVCYLLFGHSTLKDTINSGTDVHAYTGAQLAQAMDSGFAHQLHIRGATTRLQFYEYFRTLEHSKEKTEKDLYKKFRKMAKPTNFGYPGGLGPDTFIAFAKSPYGVIVNRDEALLFRKLWKETYPEMGQYLEYINTECVDQFNRGWDEDEKKEYDLYAYESPMGMHRAGCGYCSAANGLGVQTPAAEGMKTALINIIRACYDWSLGSILGPDSKGPTVRVWGDIHDEFVGEVREDDFVHERMMEMRRIMVEAMTIITPDVKADAKPALMRRWDKAAEPVYDSRGRLTIWTPEEK